MLHKSKLKDKGMKVAAFSATILICGLPLILRHKRRLLEPIKSFRAWNQPWTPRGRMLKASRLIIIPVTRFLRDNANLQASFGARVRAVVDANQTISNLEPTPNTAQEEVKRHRADHNATILCLERTMQL